MKKSVPMIGNTFLRMTESLSIYSVYFNHQQGASDTLDHVIKTSPAFKSFLDKCNQVMFTHRITFSSLFHLGSKSERSNFTRPHYQTFSTDIEISSPSKRAS